MKEKVLVAMSGGLDSSVSAILLKQAGYDIIGITFRPYDSISKACLEKETGCCNADTLLEAKQLAENIGFEHHIIDLRKEFKKIVINNFIDEYLKGRTPNPCVLCNRQIKWGALMKEADKYNCKYLATGHYANVVSLNNRYFLQKAADKNKDQSYFLWMLEQEQLKRTLFPLGRLTKDTVREISLANGFTKLAEKKESQEICFIPDDNYRKFLSDNTDRLPGKGNFIDESGSILGQHNGFPFYTIGQRKGLNIAVGHPLYVTKIDNVNNTVTLGEKSSLTVKAARVDNLVFMKYTDSFDNKELEVKIRYKTPPIPCKIKFVGSEIIVFFQEDANAVTPGQSAVFYEGNDVIGGGIIR